MVASDTCNSMAVQGLTKDRLTLYRGIPLFRSKYQRVQQQHKNCTKSVCTKHSFQLITRFVTCWYVFNKQAPPKSNTEQDTDPNPPRTTTKTSKRPFEYVLIQRVPWPHGCSIFVPQGAEGDTCDRRKA